LILTPEVQMAVKLAIEPLFEADFVPCSFGFRPEKIPRMALSCIAEKTQAGYSHVVDRWGSLLSDQQRQVFRDIYTLRIMPQRKQTRQTQLSCRAPNLSFYIDRVLREILTYRCGAACWE
jgi:hypothetical protein